MTTYRVYDIQWDTDGKRVTGLPKEAVVEIDDNDLDEDEAESAVVDRVSDDHGWLIADCKIEQVA